jgi:hypothetical protein
MKIPKISYINFISLPEDKRLELQEVILVADIFTVDCKLWTWGKVKDVQSMLDDDITYKVIFDIANMEGYFKETTDFHIVLGMFNAIQKSITEITLTENTAMAYTPKPKEIEAANEVGGFERFGSIPQTLKLVQLLNCSYNDVNNTAWGLCFLALYYDKISNDFNKKVLTT